MNSPGAATGALLSRDEIDRLCRGGKLIPHGFDEHSLKPAAYDLRAAPDALITPDHRRFKEGEPYGGVLILEPGQTAFVTTLERFALPATIAGNIFIKGDLARRGVILLTGLVVDPGYGTGAEPAPLHFYLANLGKEPVAIEPGHTKIVTIQFLRVPESATPIEPPVSAFRRVLEREDEAPGSVLGFIEDLAEVKNGHRDLVQRFEAQDRVNRVLLVAVAFVFAVTVLGVALSSLLSLAADKKAVEAANTVLPDTPSGRLFAAALVLGVAWIVHSLSRLVSLRKPELKADRDTEPALWRREAIASLRFDRALRLVWLCVASVPLLAVAVWAGVKVGDDMPWWPLWVVAGAVIALALGYGVRTAWRPITADDVKEETLRVTFVEPAAVQRDLRKLREQVGDLEVALRERRSGEQGGLT